MGMFSGSNIDGAFAPFFSESLVFEGDRGTGSELRSFRIGCRGNLSSAEVLDPGTGYPTGDREWTVSIRFRDWTETTDPEEGDKIYAVIEGVTLAVNRVQIIRADGEYHLICSEVKTRARRGI